MSWVFLSPHFDDVALSCGGLVWELARSGNRPGIWTVCAGEPPLGELSPFATELHARWEMGGNAPAQRKLEDANSCRILGANQGYFSIPDCIYRRHPLTQEFMYASESALNAELQPGDFQVIQSVQKELISRLESVDSLVCPLGLGNHVDHQLTRTAAEGLGYRLWYYADFPYVLNHNSELEQLQENGWVSKVFLVSNAGLIAWIASVGAHTSQISTFWPSNEEMAHAITAYLANEGGVRLWQKNDQS